MNQHRRNLRKVRESVSGDGGSGHHTTNGDHCQTSILQFSELVFLELLGILWFQTQRIKSVVTRGTVVFVHVGQSGESAGLDEGDPSEDLDHGSIGQGIVCIDDIGDGVEAELLTRNSDEFGNNETDGCQHGSTSVLQFGLTVPWDPFGRALFFDMKAKSKRQLKGSSRDKRKYRHTLLTPQKSKGSQLAEVCWIPAKGMGSGPSPPT
ncbi:unnamed protein product [Pseudo-nitzschia multistriata]|uniref:Uncharacterized protein n=1 Tax=Pseudo-nitzschia multistriata TaxID=183589 RepID=A0A448YW79_9STRA|nr:unnamed protein product [Pseudo-nitzschia multistriata]